MRGSDGKIELYDSALSLYRAHCIFCGKQTTSQPTGVSFEAVHYRMKQSLKLEKPIWAHLGFWWFSLAEVTKVFSLVYNECGN